MKYRIYYKKWTDKTAKPIICEKSDNFNVIDFSIARSEVAKSFNPENVIDKVKNIIHKDNGGIEVNYRDSYVGKSLITWHFGKSFISEGEVAF